MGYWKSKVLPTINKVFKKDTAKKAAAAEACKSFDDSKEEIKKEFEEKKTDLQPKVVEIYEASSVELKTLVKEPKDAGLKKHSALVQKFLEELAKIEFPGSKPVSEASSKFGPAYVSGPVYFIFEKVSTFIVVEEKAKEVPAAEETSSKEKEIVVEEEKKEGIAAEAEKTTEPPAAVEAAVAAEPPAKVEEAAEPPAAATKVEEGEPPKP
ncbi:endomembrane-associated protein, putative [Ricinus communis]|uniref:Endomembrane-associated protein, putative n=1 Tax=Ricinus communis TaxID=3988 RepID=B9T394_RICCO|nr:endomembrane-associated protein, putative [Ricinus communis]|eukprot:XP_015583044.1 plasma membrane-associated cation-binding protein 1 [Ricinus communis]